MSPAHAPSILSFTSIQKKRKAEQDMERYSAAKRRRENKENAETTCDVNNVKTSIECSDKEDPISYPSNSVCTYVQTDLTLN